jgi:hypothetical protein
MSKNDTFKHYCQCCGKELSPILHDMRLINIDGHSYCICEECFKVAESNGIVEKKK